MFHVILILVFLTRRIESSSSTTTTSIINRRTLLHQPLFPIDSVPPPTATQQPPLIPLPSPSPSPRHHHHSKLPKQKKPKHPFSSQTPPPYNHGLDDHEHFFPTYTSPPSPPSSHPSPSSSKSVPTFPANISSISLPPSSSSKPISHKFIAITVSLVFAALIALLAASLHYHRRRHKHIHPKLPRSDSLRLYPSNTATSDKPPPPPPPPRNPSNNSAEFLYIGTLANTPNAADYGRKSITLSNVAGGSSSVLGYQRLGSPELHPLPPLPRHNFPQNSRNAQVGSFDDDEDDADVEFFSPKASPNGNESSSRRASQSTQGLNCGNRSSSNSKTAPSSDSASPARTMSSSPSSLKSNSPVDFPPSPQREGNAPSPSSPERSSGDTQNSPARVSNFTRQQYVPVPEPPPMPPVGFWEATVVPPPPWSQDPVNGPPVLAPPTRSQNPSPTENLENVMEIQKPKLKALHWDKVKASSSNRAMVWDQLKSSTSFQLNEEMMETLFMVKSSNSTNPKSRLFLPTMNHENRRRLLDPKKSQNIAILLRALNVTIDEVCEGLLEGNIDTLGTELLESLLKMAPTKEEEHNLREFNDASPSKLDPAEKFLKALLDVPFAFKRVDALLYITNFDSEVEYLNRSFETLEAACDELRNSRMFLKLLEAVLKTGNRMNVGTNRGDAHAFKLDTLLKLVDVKGTDGRTTLLHFVVQEIIRAEGSRLSVPNQNPTAEIEIDQQSELRDDVEFRKLGLQVVSGLSGELSSVKKAAAMDSHVLYSEVGKLATGITKIGEVVRLNEELGPSASCKKFTDSMNGFLKKAKNCIIKIQAQESVALSMVKETTEYFHGNSMKEEAHPFRIFMVVRDFLSILDQVCKEVGKINERTIVSSARQFQTPLNQSLPSVFPQFQFQGRHQYSSSADEMSFSP